MTAPGPLDESVDPAVDTSASRDAGAPGGRRDPAALPRRAVARTARLAALPLGYAGRTTVGWGRRLAGAPADAVLTGVQQATAEQVFRTLGELKGGAMKFGQAMSVFEAAMPEELARPYRETLTKLQDAAPPMEPATVRRVLARELGSSWRTKFASFDEDPAAAASIGQVHRARWHDGREVAVKLQYPGAKEALESDLRQISRVARLLGSMMPGIEIGPLLTELRERIVEELDYDLEAQAQAVFAAAYEGDPGIVVPSVVMHTPRLLVTTWMDSEYSLARLIAEGTQQDRDRYGAAYVHFLFSGPRRTGLLHADPHPGNFRIIGDGRLGVVDFGAVARFPAGSIPLVVGRLLRRAVEDDYDAVLAGLRTEGFIRSGVDLDAEVLRAYLAPFVEPARVGSFHFTRDWLRGQAERVNSPRKEDFATALKINLPPEYLLLHRVWVGGIGVLSQLGAQARFRAILEDALPGFGD